MSAQSMSDAFAPIDERYRQQVIQDAWGHLAPQKGRVYKCNIVFAVGCFGDDPLNPTVLACNFDDLEDSPWLFDAIQCFIGTSRDVGGVYRFVGAFRNYKFSGKTILLAKY